ncbi:MAG: HDIG domain-containing protein [candidate division Zixibacteria bacterium]|nr:HDIG domain-containing protein [candidate division Zixibacteria bacterium]
MYRIILRLKRFVKRILKVKSEARQAPSNGTRSKIDKFLMLFLAAAFIALLYPGKNLLFPLDYPQKGEISFEEIRAPFQVTVAKTPEELRAERETAAYAVPAIIDYDRPVADSALSRFEQFMMEANSALDIIGKRAKSSGRVQFSAEALIDSLKNAVNVSFPFVDGTTISQLLRMGSADSVRTIVGSILRDEIYFTGVLHDLSILPGPKTRPIIIRLDKREVFVVRDKLLDISKAYINLLAALNNRTLSDSFDVDLYYDLGRHFIIPNLNLNEKEMQLRIEAAMAEISLVSEVVPAGDVIVRAGSRVTERQEKILESLYHQVEIAGKASHWYLPLLPIVARLILTIIVFLMLYLYLYYFHRRIYMSNPKILALFLIYGLELISIYMIGVKLNLSIYLFPVAIFSILITVLFDARLGIFNTFILAILLGILHRFNFSITLITVIIGTVACYATSRVRQRSEFLQPVAYLSMTYIALVLLAESFKVSPAAEPLNLIGYGVINSIISPLLTVGILPIFESLFGFTTDITLLELSDLNHPLLKRLSLEAPGTYHHSIVVGNLAEAAAKAINANSLLARVGAYYHDVGKIEIPEYFVENQLGIKSKHEGLTPSMSAIILASHVKKGRQLGEEADLPDEILNFIEEHHGTMIMTYFLNKAKEIGMEDFSVDDYRYFGPKPQTRETAIVMLADSVEAASRTLVEPKSARIGNLVHDIITDRIQSRELEECPLTLKDLADIQESFTQILTGVFHHRIEYPQKEEDR